MKPKRMRWRLPVILIVAVAMFATALGGCSSHPIAMRQTIPIAMEPRDSRNLPEYQIRPGDDLDIKFFYNSDLNESVKVRPDGRISLQLVGELVAAGLTPGKLSQILTQKYSHELREPAITVIVKNFIGQQIYVGGEVEREGPVGYTPGITVLQAIIKAGGFKETAKPEDVIVIRRTRENEMRPYHVDLDQAYRDPYAADMWLRPDDVVFVSKTTIAEMDKFVQQYIADLILFRGWGFSLRGFNAITYPLPP
jgi:protein involved in polysaccharide export with SLBB domain